VTDAVATRVRVLDAALNAHAGGLELVEVAGDGAVAVRYTGMCTGCPMRPLTTAATVRPVLLELEGVTAVRVEGSRISEEAEQRLAAALAPTLELAAARNRVLPCAPEAVRPS
jgi:Fe-S cluster biogenesis protein NfuA